MMCYTIEEIKDKTIPIAKNMAYLVCVCLVLMQEEKQMMTVM